MTMSTTSTVRTATTAHPHTLRGRLSAVPWLTVVPLAVVMGSADGFWVVSLRGTAGSIERTQGPFMAWLRETTLALPVFLLAVFVALTLAARWFGPVLRKPKTLLATALLVVAAGTLVGIAELAASSAYDYNLQSSHLMGPMGAEPTKGSKGGVAQQQQASLGLQLRSVGYGSGMLLVTNLVLVGWVVAMRGGQLGVTKTRP